MGKELEASEDSRVEAAASIDLNRIDRGKTFFKIESADIIR